MKELSVSSSAAYDESTTTTTTKTASKNNDDAMTVKGEVLSYYSSSRSTRGSGGVSILVAVKICEEDWISPTTTTTTATPTADTTTRLTAAGLGAGSDGSVPAASSAEGRPTAVGLANSLFSKSSSSSSCTTLSTNPVKGNTSLKRVIGKLSLFDPCPLS